MMYCVTFCVMLLVMPVIITQIYLNGKNSLVALSLYGFIYPLRMLSPTFIFIYEMDLFHWQLDGTISTQASLETLILSPDFLKFKGINRSVYY